MADDELRRQLDLETTLDEDAQEMELRRVLAERLLPAVDAALTLGLRRLEEAGNSGHRFVRKEARAVLADQREAE